MLWRKLAFGVVLIPCLAESGDLAVDLGLGLIIRGFGALRTVRREWSSVSGKVAKGRFCDPAPSSWDATKWIGEGDLAYKALAKYISLYTGISIHLLHPFLPLESSVAEHQS